MVPADEDGPVEVPYPQYRCALCGEDLPLGDAHMSVTCAEHRVGSTEVRFEIRPAVASDRHEIEAICDQAWGETEIDVFGRTFDVLACDNLVAIAEDGFAGLISLAIDRGELAVVLLTVYPRYQGSGVGAALVEAAVGIARERRLPFIKVATTNDDIPALYFYQRRGFVLYELVAGEMVDHHGEVVPGFAGIAVRDELHLRRPVC
ncbi:MAG: GNAT family N-acetyltransferase [Coriobacteriia bacterium]|nr:GNAT family N-acetyltransferase [Coriobacteriia bacterium]